MTQDPIRRLEYGPHELDPKDCEVVDDISLLRILYEMKAPKMFVPAHASNRVWASAFYVRKEDAKAARALLGLSEDEPEPGHDQQG